MAILRLADRVPRLPDAFYWIADSATLIGDVSVAGDAGIWFGAVLRGDNEPVSVGAGSNVQDGAVLHTDPGFPLVIGRGCTIGHQAMLHGCVVGDGSLIGIRATVLNGARIGRRCLVGAGALVTGGQEIPDETLVIGVPARVARPLSGDEIGMLARSAAGYIEKARLYARELAPCLPGDGPRGQREDGPA